MLKFNCFIEFEEFIMNVIFVFVLYFEMEGYVIIVKVLLDNKIILLDKYVYIIWNFVNILYICIDGWFFF